MILFYINPLHLSRSHLLPFNRVLCAIILIFASNPASSTEKELDHSYQSCTMITTELLTTIQLYEKGIPLDLLIESLPSLSKEGEKRVRLTYLLAEKTEPLSSYSTINSDYAKCAKNVFSKHGKPAPTSIEYGYYFCSGENKLRYEIALTIYLKAKKGEVIPQLPRSRQNIGEHYFNLAEKNGLASVFDLMANSLKHCVNQLGYTQ